jgi:uncharacterized protein YhaN
VNIERVHVQAFGRLQNFDTGPESLPGLVVALGPNETGKSTLFHFLTTALYGFHPASRESNPYLPWGAEEAGGSIRVRLDSGGCADIERYLRSQPGGKLSMDGRVEELRNRALPWVEHVPRQVFRQVFAVTLGDLAGLDPETWARVQDRILGSMGTSDVQPARLVAEALEHEASALWRPHRRGNQQIRDLQATIRELRARRGEAQKRDAAIREQVEERERTRESLARTRAQRQRQRVDVERAQLLAPIRAQLTRIATLREEGGPRDVLRALPADPGERLTQLEEGRADLTSRIEEVERDTHDPESAITLFDDRARSLLSRAAAIESFVSRGAGVAADRAAGRALTDEVRDLERRLEAAAAEVLAVPWPDAPRGAVRAVSLSELRERVRAAQRDREDRRVAEASAGLGTDPIDGRAPLWVGAGLTLAGATLLLLGVLVGPVALTTVGVALLAMGATLLAVWARSSRASVSRGGAPGQASDSFDNASLTRARSQEQESRTAVEALLRDVPIARARLEEPGEMLVSDLERLQGLLRELGDRRQSCEDVTTRLAQLDAEASGLAAVLDTDAGLEAEVLASMLDRELRRAERLRDASDGAERELRRLRRQRDRLSVELAGIEDELAELSTRLSSLADRSDQGLVVVKARQAAHARGDELEDELERAHPELPDLRIRIEKAEAEGESWTMDDGDLAARRTRIEHLGEDIERLATVAEALDRDLAHMGDLETTDAVDGEIAGLQEEESRLVRERDRRWVLAQLIREADRRFREEHQPELIRRAGSYLAHLTGGKYDRIVVDETARGDLFHLVGPGLPRPVPLTPPISTGTLEQAYLALRLAIVDQLDQGGERLPLFIDEVFVNWDRERRDRGLEVLEGLSRVRQLFVFTCHPEVAEQLSGLGARVLELDPHR